VRSESDFATDEGSLGMPADARGVFTIGAADRLKKAQSYSAPGPAMSLQLLPKPDILVVEDGRLGPEGAIAYGTSLATPHAAGLAARALFNRSQPTRLVARMESQPNPRAGCSEIIGRDRGAARLAA
jgi:hypothetical protein